MKLKMVVFALFLMFSQGRAAVREQVWLYRLLEGSYLLDDCAVCAAPSFQIPMRGVFLLRLAEEGPLGTRYTIESLSFHAGQYQFTGGGTYELSGAVALRQAVTLTGILERADEPDEITLANEDGGVSRRWPMLAVNVKQKDGTFFSTITMNIAAAPIRDLWFSTTRSFHQGGVFPPDDEVSSGDLLTFNGGVVKRNSQFQFFPGPTFLNMGLDAFTILPGAQVVFSTETMGALSDGDFANLRTRAITRWQDYMKLLAPELENDPGLDGLGFVSGAEFYYSAKQDIMSSGPTSPHLILGHGDMASVNLSARTASVFKKNADLLANFNPAEQKDYGLDAFYVWPSGEIWFSTAEGFSDNQLGVVTDGDLLSDSGYIVDRNLELMEGFAPTEDLSNFGLDTVYVVSDAVAEIGDTKMAITRNADKVALTWTGPGRVFEVERAPEVDGPWLPSSGLIPELLWEEEAPASSERFFYRLSQW